MEQRRKKILFIAGLGLGLYVYLQSRKPRIENLPGSMQITDLYSNITDLTPVTAQEYAQGTSIIDTIKDAGEFIMSALTGSSGVTGMKNVNRLLINHPQIRAFLAVIRRGEGTGDAGGYNRLFGGGTFSSYAQHPNQLVVKSGYRSTAAGAYQFIKSTWDETAAAMGLRDFSPASQDIGALGRLAYRGAIDDILKGNFEAALKKTGKEWASLPFSPYGQPVISYQTALNVFKQNGGNTAGTVMV